MHADTISFFKGNIVSTVTREIFYPFTITSRQRDYLIDNPEAYQNRYRGTKIASRIFQSIASHPFDFFYAQYAQFYQISPEAYSRMCQLELAQDPRREHQFAILGSEGYDLYWVIQKEPKFLAVEEIESKKVRINRNPSRQHFCDSTSYVLRLSYSSEGLIEHKYILVSFPMPVAFKSALHIGIASVKEQDYTVLDFKDVFSQIPNNQRSLMVSRYQVSHQPREFSSYHALIAPGSSHIAAPDSRIKLPQPVDVYDIKKMRSLLNAQWKKSRYTRCHKGESPMPLWKKVICGILISVIVVGWIIFEVYAVVRKWHVSVGIFQNIAVWLVGLFGMTAIFMAGLLIYQRNLTYHLKQIEKSELTPYKFQATFRNQSLLEGESPRNASNGHNN
ncbi:MAG: hypothetical protein VXW87_01225 [Pseudomonadota bacterium]|nr:hypothetical protein [Pseudomonadota bacterium]